MSQVTLHDLHGRTWPIDVLSIARLAVNPETFGCTVVLDSGRTAETIESISQVAALIQAAGHTPKDTVVTADVNAKLLDALKVMLRATRPGSDRGCRGHNEAYLRAIAIPQALEALRAAGVDTDSLGD